MNYLPWLIAAWTLGVFIFFFVATRGALLWRQVRGKTHSEASLIYPAYSNPWLIRLIDHQFIISAILLFQYRKLTDHIEYSIRQLNLAGQRILITSCPFGNMIPRVAHAALNQGAQEVMLLDLLTTELDNAKRKLQGLTQITYHRLNALATALPDQSVAVNVIYFLLHELPDPQKRAVVQEALRTLQPGGLLFLAEFHRPNTRLMQAISWLYFKTFEPLGLSLWSSSNLQGILKSLGVNTVEIKTLLCDNYQVAVVTKSA
jgi:ubiquinone/menaquinone biosynthesis C-methylase UbiE